MAGFGPMWREVAFLHQALHHSRVATLGLTADLLIVWATSGPAIARPKLARMSSEQVALIPRCGECGDVWLPDDEERWAYLDCDEELCFSARSAPSASSTTRDQSLATKTRVNILTVRGSGFAYP